MLWETLSRLHGGNKHDRTVYAKLSARWAHFAFAHFTRIMKSLWTALTTRISILLKRFVSPGIPSVSRIQSCRDRSTQWCNGVIIQRKSLFFAPCFYLRATAVAEITEQQMSRADCAKIPVLASQANSFTRPKSVGASATLGTAGRHKLRF